MSVNGFLVILTFALRNYNGKIYVFSFIIISVSIAVECIGPGAAMFLASLAHYSKLPSPQWIQQYIVVQTLPDFTEACSSI